MAWLESENALDRPRAGRLGLDLSSTLLWGPPTVEDGFAYIDTLIKNISDDKELQGVPVLIVWDTIAAAPIRAEKEGDPFSGGMSAKPRIISQALRNYCTEFFKYKVHLLIVNQSISNIDPNPHAPKTITPGGRAIKFYSSLRIKCKRIGWIGDARNLESTDQRTGIRVKVEAVKNKLALPFRPAELHLYGDTGYDDMVSLAEYLLVDKTNADLLEQKGGRYGLPGGKSVYWKDLRKAIAENPEILQAWRQRAADRIPLPPNRVVDPKTGWVIRKPGTTLEETKQEDEEAPEE